MSWRVQWDDDAERDLREIGLEAAALLDAAVTEFARTRRGLVFRVSSHDRRRLQVVVAGAAAYVYADEREGVLHVSRAFKRPVLKAPS